jgi:hypothetical protein
MKFITGLLVIAVLLVVQGSYPALLMAGFVSIVGCLAVGFHANAVAQKAFRRQQRLNTDLSQYADEIDSWEDYWEQQDERYLASLTGAAYLDATGVHEDDRGTEQERLMAEVKEGKVPSIFHPCGWCRRCALHDDPGACLTVEEYERDFAAVAAILIARAAEQDRELRYYA